MRLVAVGGGGFLLYLRVDVPQMQEVLWVSCGKETEQRIECQHRDLDPAAHLTQVFEPATKSFALITCRDYRMSHFILGSELFLTGVIFRLHSSFVNCRSALTAVVEESWS